MKTYSIWHRDVQGRAGTNASEKVLAKSAKEAIKISQTRLSALAVGGKIKDIFLEIERAVK